MVIRSRVATEVYMDGWDRIFGKPSLDSRKRVYLAGPMRGHKDFNFDKFCETAKKLTDSGWFVFNPAQRDIDIHGRETFNSETGDLNDLPPWFDLRGSFAADTHWICTEAHAVALLPGWETSKGARAERALAEALGLEIIEL